MSTRARIIDFIVYQSIWCACVFGAGGPVAIFGTVAMLAWALFNTTSLSPEPVSWRAIAFAGLAGVLVENGLIAAQVISYPDRVAMGPLPSPLWMLALWAAFGVCFRRYFGWAHRTWRGAAILGVVGGPLAYFGGERAGALEIVEHHPIKLAMVCVSWAAAMVTLRALDVIREKTSTSNASAPS